MTEQPKPLTDLGWQNGWREAPQIVKDCTAKNHVRERDGGAARYHCVTVVTCRECGYTYRVDSSD